MNQQNEKLTLTHHDTDDRKIFAAFHMNWHFHHLTLLLHSGSLHFHAPFDEETSVQRGGGEQNQSHQLKEDYNMQGKRPDSPIKKGHQPTNLLSTLT